VPRGLARLHLLFEKGIDFSRREVSQNQRSRRRKKPPRDSRPARLVFRSLFLMNEFAMAPICPRVVREREVDAIGNGRMAVEEENVHGIGRRIGQIDLA